MSRDAPGFFLYTDDFIAGTVHLSDEEVGAYIRLLCFQSGKGSVRNPERIVRSQCDRILEEFFEEVSPGEWQNRRLRRVKENEAKNRRKQSEAGKAGAAARWGDSDRNAIASKSQCDRNGETMASSSSSSSSSSSVSKERERAPTRAKAEREEDFEEWWKVYPRKIGKAAARKKWASLARSGELPSLDALLSTLRAHCREPQWTKDGGEYIPHPTTYLNQGRYLDEFGGNGKPAAPQSLDEIDATLAELKRIRELGPYVPPKRAN